MPYKRLIVIPLLFLNPFLLNGSLISAQDKPKENQSSLDWELEAKTYELLFETAVQIQRELLLHYAAKKGVTSASIYYTLGLNYVATDHWKSAEVWFQKAKLQGGEMGRLANIWLIANDYQAGKRANALKKWESLNNDQSPKIQAEILRARSEAGTLIGVEISDTTNGYFTKARFINSISHSETPLPNQPLATRIINEPIDKINLGKVDFSDRTVVYDLALHDPVLLKWNARYAWLKCLSLVKKEQIGLKLRALRKLKRFEEALNICQSHHFKSCLEMMEEGAFWFVKGKEKHAWNIWQACLQKNQPDLMIKFGATAAELNWNVDFWSQRIQSALHQLRNKGKDQALSSARFENKYRSYLWTLTRLRLQDALNHKDEDNDFLPKMDLALQTLGLTFKSTSRHRLSAHQPDHLALAGFIYSSANRLDDFLYYPYDESMLPTRYPSCRFIREDAIRLQAVVKLERPQLENKKYQPVNHYSRNALLFGKTNTADLETSHLSQGSIETKKPNRTIFIVVVLAGLLLIILAFYLFLRKEGLQ